MLDIRSKLAEIELTAKNSVVISSGILQALNIRPSNDIDVIVAQPDYLRLAKDGRFKKAGTNGREILTYGLLEIGMNWEVLGKSQLFDDLAKQSVVIDGIRFITIDFLLAVKRSWLKDDEIRQKDIDDVKLIEEYLRSNSN